MNPLAASIERARQGNVDAYGEAVRATQHLVQAVALRILRQPSLAQDAAQETYLRAFRRLGELEDPNAFQGWLRRIAVTVAINLRRSRRRTLLSLDDVDDVPVLDEGETRWSEVQRRQLAAALVTLGDADRRICDRRYHAGWSIARLAEAEGIDEPAMRKRLQRIRDRLRKEIEMAEARDARDERLPGDFPAQIVELLARPRLIDLPENPVGLTTAAIRSVFADAEEYTLPEVVDLTDARKSIARQAMYIEEHELHWVDDHRILRYDLTLPMFMAVRYPGRPVRLWASGKCYRRCQTDALHMEAFHQAEVLWIDDKDRIDRWDFTGRVLRSVDVLMPGAVCRIVPTAYAMCEQAWELEVERHGRTSEVLAWGVYSDAMVRHLGADPERHTAFGAGYGLERVAALRYDIDDIRRMETERVS